MYIMEVGKVIKIKRIEKDLKVKELASRVDITEQYMSNIEHGKRNPSLKLLKKLAKELGCSVYEFIEEQDKGMIEDEQRFQRNMDTKGDMAK